ncbi:restriction endonuclease subunit S [Pelotomaculum terephthalicicum JT]|uniref:restriction endonuclease subunit S n=1 Tax=Pelotomaculum terephthalicicum TaxID=206393 RepID=UPI0009D21448|nr:restriction endonuclease subunit S [Pelotomaculum terephthalicicum]MCG9967346.1 restriction endonuclease subunit S [Pelotomaculum terephthalicicum JT]OPX92371.1 MAG: Type-1 restriction enzyme EcoKI specificity protein [Pelotomaculum sp. PtaB.Bin104]
MTVHLQKLGNLILDGFQNGLYAPLEKYGTGIFIIRINDYDNEGRINTKNLLRVDIDDSEVERFSLKENDILINRVNSLTHLGKSCLIRNVCKPIVYESNMMRLRIPPESSVIPEYVAHFLQTPRARNYFRIVAKPAVAQASINQEDVKSLSIPLFEKEVQIEIAEILSCFDIAIVKTERLIEVKEKRYSWLLNNLIFSYINKRGQIRDFTSEISKRNRDGSCNLVLSVTNHSGFVLPEEQFERRVASSDLSNYKMVLNGQFAYNPSRINVGSIARLDSWERGVLSPMYVVFKLNEKIVNSDFFLHWLSSHEAKERIRKSAQGSVRETVSFTDFGAIPFSIPPLEQQQKIADVLNTAQQEINILKKLADSYRKQKRGLMQKLLTGQWRVKTGEGIES